MSCPATDFSNARGGTAMIYPGGEQIPAPVAAIKALFAGLFGAQRWPSLN